jgi:DNA-binding NarL/FixJ family response regulator
VEWKLLGAAATEHVEERKGMSTHFGTRLTVGVVESQPVLVEGLRAILQTSGPFSLLEPVASLDALTRLVVGSSPRIVLIDKACGLSSIMDWLARMKDRMTTAAIVWGSTLTDVDALRLVRAGARGVIRKNVSSDVLLACLDAVANGGTWMEDALFQRALRSEASSRSVLTPREQQVLELVEQGLRNKDIADELGIQPGTVKIHLKHIFEKTGVRGRFGLALYGLRQRPDYLPLSA